MRRLDNQQERSKNLKLDPWYITGFTEAEGTFHVAFGFDRKNKYGVKVIPEFHINQSYLRLEILKAIKQYFNCGYIKKNHSRNKKDVTRVYVVRRRNDLLKKIIPFFDSYPLLSRKQLDFKRFEKIVRMQNQRKHSTEKGLRKIINLAYLMNEKGKYRKTAKSKLLDFLKSSETVR